MFNKQPALGLDTQNSFSDSLSVKMCRGLERSRLTPPSVGQQRGSGGVLWRAVAVPPLYGRQHVRNACDLCCPEDLDWQTFNLHTLRENEKLVCRIKL